MNDYSDIGLSPNLQSLTGPVSQSSPTIYNDYDLEAITANKIRTASLNTLQGGTLTLGGTSNGNGVLLVKSNGGSQLVTMGTAGVVMYDSADNRQFILDRVNEQISIGGLKLGGTGGLDITSSGAFTVQDGSIIYARLNVDDGFFLHDKPLRIAGNTTPAAGTANSVAIYVDNGGAAGANRLMVRFDNGSSVVLATEP